MSEVKIQTEEQKLRLLFELQTIDSKIDEITTLRGELPLQVQELEDTITGLETRSENFKEETEKLTNNIAEQNNEMLQAGEKIEKYQDQQMSVKNNREFDSLNKEIEFQKLEIELCEKKIKQSKEKIKEIKEKTKEIKEQIKDKTLELKEKQDELDAIKNETQNEETALLNQAENVKKEIDSRLLKTYTNIRTRVRNGLAVVSMDREACGGCHNKIPPQRQLDIATRKKIIPCEHCGRVLVDPMLAEEIENQVNS